MRNQLETVTGPVHTVTYSYEPGRNAMTNIENNRTVGGTGVISNYAYTYNALGQRTERAQSGSAITSSSDSFSYDALGQVTGSTNSVETTSDAWNPSYNFDMIGNRAGATVDINGSKDYTANLLNQYTAISDVPTSTSKLPINDEDGNLTSDGGSWSYTWNGENRLINADNGTVSIDFEYDYQGRLVRKDDGTNVEVYLYDGWNRIATYESQVSSFTLQVSNLWGMDLSGSMQGAGGVGGLLKEGNRYPTFDANGNIMQKLSSSGNVDMNVAYDPFGNIISGALVGEYGFSTKPLVEGIQWYYYGFRYYDPVMGRWPSRDPIGEWGHRLMLSVLSGAMRPVDGIAGHNSYAFALNSPSNLVDMDGRAVFAIPWVIGGGIKLIDVAVTIVVVGLTANEIADRKKYGNCSKAQHSALHKAVGAACKSSGSFSCKEPPKLSCSELSSRAAIAAACAAARELINNTCFSGNDPGGEAANARRAEQRCLDKFSEPSRGCICSAN